MCKTVIYVVSSSICCMSDVSQSVSHMLVFILYTIVGCLHCSSSNRCVCQSWNAVLLLECRSISVIKIIESLKNQIN